MQTLAAAAAVAVAVLTLAPAAAAPRQVPLSDVMSALPLDEAGPALYILVIDTSGSMQESGAYPAVTAAVADVVGALDPADQVSVVTFDVAPRQCGPGVFAAADPAGIAACLPPTADGEFTDIGRAFEQVVTVLENTPAAVRTVALVSDGTHEPGPGSPYPVPVTDEDPAWRALADRARAVPGVSAYSVPLSGADGATALGAVFPSPTVLQAASPADVRAALDVPLAAARRAEARALLAPDAAAEVRIDAPPPPSVGPEPVPWTLTLRSSASHVPWAVRDLALDAGPGVAVRGLPPAIELAPGEEVPVTVTLRATGDPAPEDVAARLRGSLASEWSGALDDLGLDVPAEVTADLGLVEVEPARTAAAGDVSLPPAARWAAAAAGAAVVAAGAAMAWWVLRGRTGRSPG
ncbi:MAG: VWA domain-containing protein [Kineosporiaceae bacterium]